MARRYHEIKGLAEFTAKTIVSSEEDWKKFLHTAGHMYKYPFREQMLIYAQRPDATACASLELWNEKMNCWVNKGAQGIALIDEEGVHRSGLKYVFDVKDVHEARFIGHKPKLWKMEEEHKDYVIDSLERIYGETDASRSFESRIMELANRIASEMAPDIVSEQLSMSVEGSFLEELDDLNLEVRLRDTIAASIAYTVLERCGMDADDVVGIEFPYVHEFNSIESLAVMGEATAELTEPILREIGRSISIYDREKAQEAVRAAYEEYIDPNRERAEKGLAYASERGYNALTPSGEGNISKAQTKARKGAIMEIEYIQSGDFQIPNLTANKEPEGMLTKFGLMRKNFLKKHRRGVYSGMLLKGTLKEHCLTIQEQADQRMDLLTEQMANDQGVDEQMKRNDQMKWVGLMNNIRNSAEEIVLSELIYS